MTDRNFGMIKGNIFAGHRGVIEISRHLDGLRKATIKAQVNSRHLCGDSNRVPPEYKKSIAPTNNQVECRKRLLMCDEWTRGNRLCLAEHLNPRLCICLSIDSCRPYPRHAQQSHANTRQSGRQSFSQ